MARVELSWKRKVGYSLLTLFLVLGLAEVALRFTLQELGKATIPTEQITSHVRGGMAFDPELGWKFPHLPDPGVGLNKDGFRHPDVVQQKPAGTWRAFTLGDSQTYGAGVGANQTYSAVAEAQLKQTVGTRRTVELINAGISGYTSLQALRLIRTKLLKWQPDLLIIDCRTYDAARDGLDVPASPAVARVQRVLFYSRVYYVLRFAIDRLKPNQPRRMKGDMSPLGAAAKAFGNHAQIVELARQHGAEVMFVDYPFWDQPQGRITCLAQPQELPQGSPVARVCEALQQSGHPPSDLFLDNNHPTPLGHAVMGKALAEAILASRVAP